MQWLVLFPSETVVRSGYTKYCAVLRKEVAGRGFARSKNVAPIRENGFQK